MYRKRILAVICLLTLVLVSACGKKEDPYMETESNTETVSENETQEAGTTSEELTAGPETEPVSESEMTEETDGSEAESTEQEVETVPQAEEMPKLYGSDSLATDSGSYCAVDETGTVVIGKNELMPKEPASITKVLTALVAVEMLPLDEKITIQEADVSQNLDIMSSGVYPSLKPGEELSVRDLLYALILPSTNAAGNVLADYMAGSIDGFAEMMNAKAASLGLTHSHFSNPHGLHAADHYTCAYDMAMILKAAMENPALAEILGATQYSIPETAYAPVRGAVMGHAMVNGSFPCEGVIGGKSGYTAFAGNTLVTAVERNGKRLYVCTMDSDEALSNYDTDNVIRYAYACLNGTEPMLHAIAHNAEVLGADETGMDLYFEVDNLADSARIVFWDMYQGTATAQEIHFSAPAHEVRYHLNLPYKGTFMLQFAATGKSGTESIIGTSLLYDGYIYDSGVTRWNGQDYVIGERGFLRNTAIETKDGDCYYANADGAIGRGFVGGRFYAGADGKLVSGWIEVEGNRYFCQADGRLATGALIIDGVLHHFADYGAMID